MDVRPEPVRAKPRLLVLSRQKRHDDVAEVVRAGGEHGGEGILPIAAVAHRVDAAEALADGRANFIPDGRAAKLRKLAGEYGVDGERHLHQLPAGAGVSLVGSAIAGLLGKRLGDHAQRFGPSRIVHVVGREAADRVAVIVPQVEKPRADVERSVVLLKLLMLELKRRLRVVNALENVVRRECREDRRRSHRLDLATVRKLSCDGGNDSAGISLGQCHRTAAGHLSCEGLQVVRLPAEDRCCLQRVSVFVSLFLQTENLGEDADFRGGNFGARFKQRSDFREDERRASQLVERRVGIDADAELGAFRAKAGCQISCPLHAPKAQQPQPQCTGQRRRQVVRAGCDDDARTRKIPFELAECVVRLRGIRLRNFIPAVQQQQERFRLLHAREVGGRETFGLERRHAGNVFENSSAR